jgi:para-aminobenzoate synthetase component I
MLYWLQQHSICCFLDNNQYQYAHNQIECLGAAGAVNSFVPEKAKALQELDRFCNHHNDWLFGHFAYDLKNEIEPLVSSHPDNIGFPDIFLFQPETIIQLQQNKVTISCVSNQPAQVFKNISEIEIPVITNTGSINIQARLNRQEYINTIEELRQHILRGDCYEINFCMEFFGEHATIQPVAVYQQLNALSPNPFSCFYRLHHNYLLCASPERFLQKTGNKLISQPIKGTIQRSADKIQDEQNKTYLKQCTKERSENVMVVDLVRNDLSKICTENSVQVEELFGIYSFPQLHQMISTISGTLQPGISMANILRATFPMGSMTGAPKRRVMQLIEQYEHTRRGIFSGAVGYITPDNNFDFNVVIRSIMYNANNQYLSYQVGSGITFYSNANREYEECLLKAKAIEKVLQ